MRFLPFSLEAPPVSVVMVEHPRSFQVCERILTFVSLILHLKKYTHAAEEKYKVEVVGIHFLSCCAVEATLLNFSYVVCLSVQCGLCPVLTFLGCTCLSLRPLCHSKYLHLQVLLRKPVENFDEGLDKEQEIPYFSVSFLALSMIVL